VYVVGFKAGVGLAFIIKRFYLEDGGGYEFGDGGSTGVNEGGGEEKRDGDTVLIYTLGCDGMYC